jgi:hypothetical protein
MGDALNVHIPWWGEVRSAVVVAGDLRGRILQLYDSHLSSDGRAVDYLALEKDPQFARYVDAAAELQRVDLSELSRNGAHWSPCLFSCAWPHPLCPLYFICEIATLCQLVSLAAHKAWRSC